MMRRLIIVAVMLVSGFAGGECAAQDAIGTVSRIQGEASGTRNGATRALAPNAALFLKRLSQPVKRRGSKSPSPTTRG